MLDNGLSIKYKSLLTKYGVNTPLRKAHFFAQLKSESNLLPGSENLNYSAKRLNEVFKKYFPSPEKCNAYAGSPILIGSRIYANRMGNGNELSRDGYKYRGRGFIQTTGKNNYASLSKETGIDFLNNPDLLLDEANAMVSALIFWKRIDGNHFADKDDLDAISDLINIGHDTERYGDANGFEHRKNNLQLFKDYFKP